MEIMDIVTIILGITTAARVIVRLTPTKRDDNIFLKVMKVLETLGLPDIQITKKKK